MDEKNLAIATKLNDDEKREHNKKNNNSSNNDNNNNNKIRRIGILSGWLCRSSMSRFLHGLVDGVEEIGKASISIYL